MIVFHLCASKIPINYSGNSHLSSAIDHYIRLILMALFLPLPKLFANH